MDRHEIEAAIGEEESVLAAVGRLLDARMPVERWPVALLGAFALALDDAGLARSELWKVGSLRRHLFGPTAQVPAAVSRSVRGADRRAAERLRDGLVALVRSRAGVYLAHP